MAKPPAPPRKPVSKPASKPASKAAGTLATYADKRNFGVTPEPPPDSGPPPATDGPPIFMIHKHDARRLHYDLRLEIAGALASWAVPQGPSFDPEVKRLAVQTEDHPLGYANFEGRIPDGEYGAGDALVWDRGIYETVPPGRALAMREKGHLDVLLLGEKLKGRWHVVRTRPVGGKAQWLLMKAKDEFATGDYDVVAERPESVVSGRSLTRGPTPAQKRQAPADPIALLLSIWPPPPFASAQDEAELPTGATYQADHGGQRALAAVAGGRVALQTEAGQDLAAACPAIVKALAVLPVATAIFDAEVAGTPPRLYLRDAAWLDGSDLRARGFAERHQLLAALVLPKGGPLALAEQLLGPFAAAVAAARRAKVAGLVARDPDAAYGAAGTRLSTLPARR